MDVTTTARLGQLIVDGEPDPILLVGAGASLKSGVPLASTVAEMAIRHAYCREHARSEDDQSVRRSDWLPWVSSKPWFENSSGVVDQYAAVIERLLQPQTDRREFFLKLISPDVPRSGGYDALAALAGRRLVQTILTPNFDHLIYEACRSEPKPRRVEWVKTPADVELISTSPTVPQVIHLHGSVEHYNDQNIEKETQTLDVRLKERLVPLVRDHALIVIGYRGAEPSIMCDLLMGAASAGQGFRHGVFWCSLGKPSELHPLVVQLAEKIGSNFQFVCIDGFDQVMVEWAQTAEKLEAARPSPHLPGTTLSAPDLRPSASRLDDLDWSLVGRTLRSYAEKLVLDFPPSSSRDDLTSQLVSLELAVEENGGLVPTRGGELLFSRSAVCRVEVRVEDDSVGQVIEGNALSVIDRTLDLLEDVNEPFTLKGAESKEVRPYPPLALKEFVVNALVHRDYSVADPVQIAVREGEIEIRNPGGLYELERSQLGKAGQKAYRNPVIADFCYGTGLMDKRGSGLFDVLRWSEENGGNASFAPDEDNGVFTALLVARPERPDPDTRAATPEQNLESFTSNVVPLRFLGEHVHVAPTSFVWRKEVFKKFPTDSFPPFAITEGAVVTFSDLRSPGNPLRGVIDAEPEEHAIEDFFDGEDRQRILVQLLNGSLIAHARGRGLRSGSRQRFFFAGSETGARVIDYRARLRRASRTVTRPIIRKGTNEVRFWEHECVHYQFKRFGNEWALTIVPGWLFTKDGRELLGGSGVVRLATRRSARDFNSEVGNDLVFWVRTLIGDADELLLDDSTGRIAISGRSMSLDLIPAPPAPGLNEQGDERDTVDVVLEDVGDELDAAEAPVDEEEFDETTGEAA